MPYVSYIEFNVPDPQKAKQFYAQVFNWEIQSWSDDYLVAAHGDQPGIDTGINKSEDARPQAVAVITVPDLDATLEAVKAAGGTIVVEKFPIEGVGHAAYFTDPSGLYVGVHQAD